MALDRSQAHTLTRREFLRAAGATGLSLGFALGLQGCGAAAPGAQSSATIAVRTFAGYYNDVTVNDAVPLFKKAFPNANVQMDVDTIAQRYSKLLASKDRPIESVSMFNDIYSAKGAIDDLFVKFDERFVPNFKDTIKELHPANGFGIAIAIQPFGIAYNPKYVDKPTSWTDLFNPKYVGKVALTPGQFDPQIIIARILGKSEYDVEVGIDEWAKYKKNIGVWLANFTQRHELLDKGEIWLTPDQGGTVLASKEKGLGVEFSWPKEGATKNTIIAHVMKGWSPDVTELSQRFVNVWLEPDVQNAFLRTARLSPTNAKVSMPPDLAKLDNIVTPDKAKKFIEFDFAYVAKNTERIQELMDRKLK